MEERAKKGFSLQWQMLAGFLVGLAFGLIAYSTQRDAAWVEFVTTYVTGPIGQIFLRLLFMLVIPLLFSALVVGISEMGEIRSLKRGDVVLLDCGCSVHGYQADISRTFVFGADPTAEQRKVWTQMRRGQDIAFAAAKVDTPAGHVDDAVRRAYESWGYGPGYNLPGLSHRTGHGIGMEGHEPINLVHGETTRLAPGMCFSNEPGIYLPGKFGIRLEDCFHMTASGPKYFSQPPASIDQPV